MTTRREPRNPPLYVTLFWLVLAASATIGTQYVAKALGAGVTLYTALALCAGIGTLIWGGLCCTSDAYAPAHGMK